MGARLVTPPAQEPLSLATVKLHLRVTAADEDDNIGLYIAAARDRVEEYCARKLIEQTWDVTLDAFAPNWQQCVGFPVWLELPFGPASSITSISYVDGTGATQTLDPSAYSLDTGSALPRVLGITAWPSTKLTPNAVTVRAVFGYGADPADVPASIRAAMLLLIGNLYANREAVVDSRAAIELPQGVDPLLAPYRLGLGV